MTTTHTQQQQQQEEVTKKPTSISIDCHKQLDHQNHTKENKKAASID